MAEKVVESTQKAPDIRMAIMGPAERSPMGMGVSQTLTFYGTYEALNNEHLLLTEVQDWLAANGRSRWSVNHVGGVKPLNADEMGDKDTNKDGAAYKTDVRILDTGL